MPLARTSAGASRSPLLQIPGKGTRAAHAVQRFSTGVALKVSSGTNSARMPGREVYRQADRPLFSVDR